MLMTTLGQKGEEDRGDEGKVKEKVGKGMWGQAM